MKYPRLTLPLSLLIAAGAGTSGCATSDVIYKTAAAGDTTGTTKFRFAESMIQFGFQKDAQAGNVTAINITSVPIPSGSTKYAIEGGSSTFGVTTTVLATHRADSDLLQTVSVTTTDQRVTWIKTAGSIATALIPFFVADTGKPDVNKKLPTGISMSVFLGALPTECSGDRDKAVTCTNLPLAGTSDYVADIAIGQVPPDAFQFKTIKFDSGYTSHAFLYSACRDVTVTLKAASDKSTVAAQSTLVIADPEWLEALKLPDKGKITVGAACGADADSQDAQNPNALDFANGLVAQASAVKTALEKKSSGSTSSASGAGTKKK
jgi:hypothetical protein